MDVRTMETSLYADDGFCLTKDKIRNMKRSLTLNFDPADSKRCRSSCILSSPDLNMLKLGSPELEKLIIQHNNGLVTTTPTPNPGNQPQLVFPKNVTEEQELYVRGFVDALAKLHNSNDGFPEQGHNNPIILGSTTPPATYANMMPVSSSSAAMSFAGAVSALTSSSLSSTLLSSNSSSSISSSSSSSSTSFLTCVKEEPQTVPSVAGSPPLSPIDMIAQERIKLERKRQRNRVAASKCRRRKLERIARLEDKVNFLKSENNNLSTTATQLRDCVCQLKQQLMEHHNSGCQIIPQQHGGAQSFAAAIGFGQ